jgi:TonB family protein
MTELLIRVLATVTLGLALVLLLRRPARRVFGAGSAFTLWLLPIALMLAPLLPQQLAPAAMAMLPVLTVMPHATSAASATISIDWVDGLGALWLLGAAIGTLRLVLHYSRLLRALREAPGGWTSMLSRAAPGIDTRRVRLHDAGPAVLWALPRALILLPTDFAERFDDHATRELVLRHELTHASRGDAWWSVAMELVSALLWFHPLVWLARPRFRLDQELACDATTLRALPKRTASYAHALLDSVAVQPAPALIPWLSEPQLKERISMITRTPPGAFRRRAGFAAIVLLLAGSVCVAGAMVPITAAAQTGSNSTPPTVDITYKNRNPPHYPAEALHKGEQGKVLLVITVDSTGKVVGVAVDPKRTTAPAILQTAAMQAANNWRVNPGMKNGHPVGGRITVPVTFSLSPAWTSPGSQFCPAGFRYKKGNGKSYSCIAPASARASF